MAGRTEEPMGPELVERARFGAYADNEPFPVDAHFALEQELNASLPLCSWFIVFGQLWPAAEAAQVTARGQYDLVICWELHQIPFAEILEGKHDEYIYRFLVGAGGYPGDVVLRPFHESNGTWYDWAPGSRRGYCTSAAQWKQAWRHVVSVGRRAGAANVRFMWCMNATDTDGSPRMEDLWPGSAHVDLVGADVYNFGGSNTFPGLLSDAYARITSLDHTHDFWVSETGSKVTDTVDALNFYRSLYLTREFPRLTTILYFSKDMFALDGNPAVAALHHQQLDRAARSGGNR